MTRMIDQQAIRRIHRVTALVAVASVVFFFFFQVNKHGPLGDVNPFADDPYDAVGSFAIQVALLVGILTYARAFRQLDDPAQVNKTRLIFRGNVLVLFAIVITLIGDIVAEMVRPFPPSFWGSILLGELAGMCALTLVCVVACALTFRSIPFIAPPCNLTIADAIDDAWTLLRIPVSIASRVLPLPRSLVEWVQRFNCDVLFTRAKWLSPRTHTWRFAMAVGLLAGVGLALVQLQEGPPNWMIGLLVASIFVTAEFIGAILGYILLGGYLGLRPSFQQ